MAASDAVGREASPANPGFITPGMVDALCGTRGWALLFASVIWVGSAFQFLVAFALFDIGRRDPAPLLGALFWCSLAFGVWLMTPAVLLTRYARSLARLHRQPSFALVLAALQQARRFWKFLALLTVTALGLAVAAGIASAAIAFFR